MKIPTNASANVTNLANSQFLTAINTQVCRLEFGNSVPIAPGTRFDAEGRITYTTYVPLFSVRPDNFQLNLERFDLGEVRYFSDEYYAIQNGKRRDILFPYSKISSPPI